MRKDKRNRLVDVDHTSPQNQSTIEESESTNLDKNNSTGKREEKFFHGAVYLSTRRWYIYNDHWKGWQRSTKGNLALQLRADGYDVKAMLQHIQKDHAVEAVVLRAESILVMAEGRRNYAGELDHLSVGVHITEDGRRVLIADKRRKALSFGFYLES
jgi:hypothetical protein